MRKRSAWPMGVLSFAVAALAAAAPGQLDPTFGNHGIAVTSFGNDVRPLDAVLQADGKLIVAGGLNDFSIATQVAALFRYLPDGTLDSGFGNHGLVRAALTNFENEARAVVIQTDGRIVVLVHATSADGSVSEDALLRFKSNGSPDLTFGHGGRTIIDFPHPQFFNTVANTIVLQPDNNILVGGMVFQPGYRHRPPPKTAVARFTAAGKPDTTFGTNGVVEAVLIGEPAALAVLADHTILAANIGHQTVQFTASGAVLSGVAGGTVRTSTRQGALIFQADSEILVAGAFRESGRRDIDVNVGLFETNGQPEANFNSPLFDFGAEGGQLANVAQAIAVDPDGAIVVGGLAQNSGFSEDFAVARLNPDGSLDATFGTAGRVTTSFPHGGQVLAMVVQPDRKIVAVGQAFSNDTSIPVALALARYLGN